MNGAELIAKERKRQIEEEGWTTEHDDGHAIGDLAVAGACYALDFVALYGGQKGTGEVSAAHAACQLWPWDVEAYWKPTRNDPIRQLVKAGALIAAEIDRLQRVNLHA